MEEIETMDIESFARFLDLNEAFHFAILDLANNKILRRTIEQVYKFPFAAMSSRLLLSKNLPGSKEILPIAKEHHRALIDAIEHGEGARAESLAREHSRITRRNLEEALTNKKFLDALPGAGLIKVWGAGRS